MYVKRCKFCGECATVFESRRSNDKFLNGYFVACTNYHDCCILPETEVYKSKKEAVDAWNAENWKD